MKLRNLAIIVICCVLMFAPTITVLAADDPTHDVTGSYIGNSGTPVYSYSYIFGDMKFSYSGASSGVWNPETHQFEGEASGGGWTCATGADEITIVNHSNAPINVVLTFQSSLTGVKFGFSEPTFDLESAVGTTPDNAPSKTVHVGAMSDSAGLSDGQTNVKVGTVTLHVSAK